MHPILFVIAGTPIPASQVFLVLAILIGIVFSWKEALRRGITRKEFYIYWILALPAALFLAAANSALFHGLSLNLLSNPGELASNGLISFGAIIGTLGLGIILAKVYQRPTFQLLDVISITLPLVLGIYRIGCVLNGCCHGLETDGFFGVYLPDISGEWAKRYPTQMLLVAFDFVLLLVLWRWNRKNPPEGRINLVFLLSFSVFRLILDSLRELPLVNGWLNILQLGSLSLLLITIYGLIMIQLQKPSQGN